MQKDEIEILRAVSARLDPDTLFVMTYQYHTEKDPTDPHNRRTIKNVSRYRFLGRVEKIGDLEAKMAEFRKTENRMNPWKWPDDPSWDGKILYSKNSSNMTRSNWIRLKISKALDWNDALLALNGFKRDTDPDSKTFRQFVIRNPSSAFDLKGYTCTNGDIIDLDDKDALLAHSGQNIYKEIRMKLAGIRDQAKI